MSNEKLIEILQEINGFEDKFDYDEQSIIPLKRLSTTREFIDWCTNVQDKLEAYKNDKAAQNIVETLEDFHDVDETTIYYRLRAQINVFIEHLKNDRTQSIVQNEHLPTIFVSYNEASATTFVNELKKQTIGQCKLFVYTDDLAAWEKLSAFMKTIRTKDFAVLVITEQYLKSEACLYEVTELKKDDDWREKTMFCVLDDSIYDLDNHPQYIRYWGDKAKRLDKEIDTISNSASAEQSIRLRQLQNVADNIGAFLREVSDTKNPTQYTAITEILKRIAVKTDEQTR